MSSNRGLKNRIQVLLLALALAVGFLTTLPYLASAAELSMPEAEEGSSELIEFVYVDAGDASDSSGAENEPLAVVGFADSVEAAGIVITDADGASYYIEAKTVESNAALFNLSKFAGSTFSVTRVYYSAAASADTLRYVTLSDGGEVSPTNASDGSTGNGVDVQAYSIDADGDIADCTTEDESLSLQGLVDEASAQSSNGTTTIVLDAGHGGSDSGAVGNGLYEKNLTLAIAKACRDELGRYRNVKVIMTRSNDSRLSEDTATDLKNRAKVATDAGADLFVSFHINSSTSSAAYGAEVWVPNTSSWYSSYHQLGTELGNKVLNKLNALGLSNRGNQWGDYLTYPDGSAGDYLSVIRNTRAGGVPGVLIEHGFISNSHDASLLSSASYLKQLGVADATAIAEQLGLSIESPLYGFSDIYASTDHSSEIGWLAAAGISTGYSDGSFGCMREVTRQDFAAFLYRLAGSPSYTPTSSDKAKFSDVTASSTFAKEIWWMASVGITTGFSDGTFRGMSSVTRQDMAAFLRRYAAKFLDSSASSWSSKSSTVHFSDVNSSTPHYEDILWLGTVGVTTGFSNGTFGGTSNVMRQDMAAFLYRLNNLPGYSATDKDKKAFSDVSASTAHANAIWWMASKGISTGYSDGTFGATRDVTRQDAAAFLYRLAGSPNYSPSSSDKGKFNDVNSSTPHAKEIWWLASVGIANGYSDRTFRGSASITRADMAAFLQRFFNLYGDSESKFKNWTASGKAKVRFTDVSDGTSQSNSIWWMGATGISLGFTDGSYGPQSTIVRQDLAEFLYRLYIRCNRGGAYSYKIMGTTGYKASQFVSMYKARGKSYPSSVYSSKGASSIEQFVNILMEEAKTEGVKAEVVFCQAMHETGWLQFGGDVKAEQCNFAGLGATGNGVSGNSFSDVRTGIRAQVQHLKAYASTDSLVNACVDTRFKYVTRGCAPTIGSLTGRWATDSNYAQAIYSLIQSIPAA